MSEGASDVLQPGQDIRPHMTVDTARDLVQRLYGLRVKSVKELNSYDDKNYLVKAEAECDNPHIKEVCADGYVLKVLNSMDSPKSHVEAEHQVQSLLLKKGFSVPDPVLNIHGKDLSREKIYAECPEGDKLAENNNPSDDVPCKLHIVRLLSFIPGTIFHTIAYTAPRLYMVGQYLGRLNTIVKDFHHPALESQSMWDLKGVPKLAEFVYAVKDDENRTVVNEVLAAFTETVVPLLDKLPKAIIHGDYNEQNIIVKEKPGQENKAPEDREYLINGVIDFGDLRHSCRVFDIAIAICYMMIESNAIDPLDAGGHTLAGYLMEMELNELELEILKECVAGRFAQSLVMGAYTYLQDPGNEYVLVTAAKGWSRFKLLWKTPKDELYTRWRNISCSYRK